MHQRMLFVLLAWTTQGAGNLSACHQCSTLVNLIQPYSPLSTIYCGIWCTICVPPCPTLFNLFHPFQQFIHSYSAFGAPSVFHLVQSYSSLFNLIQPFLPLSTLYCGSLCTICVPPCSTLFDLFCPCQQLIVAVCASSVFHLICPYLNFSPLSTLYCGIWCYTNVPPCSTLFTLIWPFWPLSTIYCGIWCPICIPPYFTLFWYTGRGLGWGLVYMHWSWGGL
jgi:hypothetical protein